jgi:hypothetical protein
MFLMLAAARYRVQVLGAAGYHAYKYVPYGKVEQVR